MNEGENTGYITLRFCYFLVALSAFQLIKIAARRRVDVRWLVIKPVCPLELPELNKETEVWISEPKKIKREWRLFVVDNQIISASRYMNEGELNQSEEDIPEGMMQFATERIFEYRIEDIYVMDIAEIENEYKLIECNCFNGTGFYKHDIERVIQSVNKFIKQKMRK